MDPMHFLQFDPKKMQWSNNSELEFCINYRLYTDRNTLDDSSKLVQKSVNLQYTCNTLGCLDNGTNESSTKRLMFQVLFFFMISCKFLCKNGFNSFFYFFYRLTKIKIKSFECPKSKPATHLGLNPLFYH